MAIARTSSPVPTLAFPGEGGMLLTDRLDFAERAARLREHGMNVSAAARHATIAIRRGRKRSCCKSHRDASGRGLAPILMNSSGQGQETTTAVLDAKSAIRIGVNIV